MYLALCATCSVLFASSPTYAADDISITMAPVSEDIETQPRKQYDKTLTIFNPSTTTFSFTMYATPYQVANERYDPVFDAESPHSQLHRWVSFPEQTYTIAPKQRLTIPYAVTTPATLPDGGQYAAIFAETVDHSETSDLITKKRVGLLLYTHAKGTTIYSGSSSMNNPPMVLSSPQYTLQARVMNTGNVDFKATVSLDIRGYFSGTRIYSRSFTKPILPSTTRLMPLEWKGDTNFFGAYRVTQTINYLDKTTSRDYSVFVVSPALGIMLVIAVCLLVLLACTVVVVVHRHRKRTESMPGASSSSDT